MSKSQFFVFSFIVSVSLTVFPSSVNAQTLCQGLTPTITETGSDGVIRGTDGDDVIQGTDSDDIIVAGDGHDIICAGDGDDRMYGQDGRDVMYGEGGRDRMFGGANADVMYGGTSGDIMKGGKGADIMYGEGAGDRLIGNGGNDFMVGGGKRDRIVAGSGDDTIWADNENKTPTAYNVIISGDGNDIVNGNTETDPMECTQERLTDPNDPVWAGLPDDAYDYSHHLAMVNAVREVCGKSLLVDGKADGMGTNYAAEMIWNFEDCVVTYGSSACGFGGSEMTSWWRHSTSSDLMFYAKVIEGDFHSAGENLFAYSAGYTSASEMIKQWILSNGHFCNMISPLWTQMDADVEQENQTSLYPNSGLFLGVHVFRGGYTYDANTFNPSLNVSSSYQGGASTCVW